MRRRAVLKSLLTTVGVATTGFRLPLANAADYRGKFYVFVQAAGGWDPTSFCDPKVNQKGEEIINHWAEDLDADDVPQAGKIRYAPFAKNEGFFENHYEKMLVINGVDAQTNSHTAGVVHNWSGRISEGYPTTTALLAADLAPEMPMGYLSFGGYSVTGGLTRYTRLKNLSLLRNIAEPPSFADDPQQRYLTDADWRALRNRQASEVTRLVDVPDLLPMERDNRHFYRSASMRSEGLKAYAAAIPPEEELKERVHSGVLSSGNDFGSDVQRQAQLAVLAFKTGVAISADLWQGGFDTHSTHDPDHEWLLAQLTDGVDYLWDYAEQHGVADRMVVVIGSDFGRTNFYNSEDGKDHWPYGSFVIMEKNQPWTNRVVGETDELHFAYNIDPATLERANENDPNGTHIYPKHVHKALRRYLGIEKFAAQKGFPFNNTEDFAFFG